MMETIKQMKLSGLFIPYRKMFKIFSKISKNLIFYVFPSKVQ